MSASLPPEGSEPPGRRDGFWIRTASGGRFFPLDPRAEDIRIEDVAHALSNLARFTGHTREFYSVAQHCRGVSAWVEAEARRLGFSKEQARALALEGLLHDGSEAYLNDISTPVKRQPELAGYRAAEERVRLAFVERFGLPREESALVKKGDRILLVTEARDLLPCGVEGFGDWGVDPLPAVIRPERPARARELFLRRFEALGGRR